MTASQKQADQRRTDRRQLQDRQPLRHQARLQPADGRRARTSSWRTRPTAPGTSAQYMRVDWSKNLVTDAYDYDTLSLHRRHRRRQVRAVRLHVIDPNDPDAPHFDADRRATSTSPTRRTRSPSMIDLVEPRLGHRHVPGLLPRRRLRRRHRTRAATATRSSSRSASRSAGRRHRLRADRLGRLPLPGLGALQLRLPPGLRPQLRHGRRQVAPLHRALQHLGAQPLLRRPGERRSGDGGADRLRHEGDHRGRRPAIRTPIRTATTRRTAPPTSARRPAPGSQLRRLHAEVHPPLRASARCRTIPWYIAGDTRAFFEPTNWADHRVGPGA